MTTVHLYDLANARAILDEFLEETEGEVTPALEELIEQLDGDVTDKVERVALYIREQLATAAAVKEEEARLVARRKSHERAAEGLKNYLQRQLERLGKTKVDGVLCTVALQKNSAPAVACANPSAVYTEPGGFMFVAKYERIEYAINRSAIIEAWTKGQQLPDGIVVEHGHHVRIR